MPPVLHGQSEAFDLFVKSKATSNLFDVYIVNLNFVNMSLFKKSILFAWRYLSYLYFFIIKRPEAIYISFGRGQLSFFRDTLCMWIAIIADVPIIAHYHGGDLPSFLESLGERKLRMVKYIFRNINRVIILGRHFGNDVKDLVNKKKVRVILNCFRIPGNLNLSSIQVLPSEKKRRTNLLYLSNVNPDKGFFEVLESVSILKCRGCDIYLNFVGSFIDDEDYTIDDLKRKTDKLVQKYSIADRVRIKGPVYGPQKWKELAEADIFVLPTYYKKEGVPISVIEGMAAGCAIITTPYRGIVDLIRDGIEGYFVKPRDSEDLANKVELLCLDTSKLNSMKKASEARAFEYFTEDKHVNSIIDVIKEVI